ncbi:MAG: low molecular weight protein-tyrosine-phosphatase [Sphingobacteriaceae bacterium]
MKLLMVCLGNICRSPMAEGIMQHLVIKQHLNWEIDSSGTGSWHIGHGPDRRSVATANRHGIDISKQICRQFTIEDFDHFDLIVVMDKSNLAEVRALARNKADLEKIELLLPGKEVPDPYLNDDLFEPVFKLIEKACADFIAQHQSLA